MNKKIYPSILLIITATLSLLGQNKLAPNLVADSTIIKLKIKKITQDWYGDVNNPEPYNTTIELFDQKARISKRTLINYKYHKFVTVFSYNLKKQKIKAVEKFYDWNPNREHRAKDTIVKKSIKKYDLRTKYKKRYKPSKLEQFKPIEIFDTSERIVERKDTIKFGYEKTKYAYDTLNNIVSQKVYIARGPDDFKLIQIDSFTYNSDNQIIEEINYLEFRKENNKLKHEKEIITKYKYNAMSLLEEEFITKKWLSLEKSNPILHLYKFTYEFY